jgi:hypothetical protein
MAWAKYRRGRLTAIALPPEIKGRLIREKALGRGGIGEQIVEALRRQWGWGVSSSQAVTNQSVPPPPQPQPIVPGAVIMHNGRPYRLQPVNRPGDPKIPDWRL